LVFNKGQAKLLAEAWGVLQNSKKIEWLIVGPRNADTTTFSIMSNQV